MTRFFKRISSIAFIFIFILLTSCGIDSRQSGEGVTSLYLINSSITSLVQEPYDTILNNNTQAEDLLHALQTTVNTEGCIAPLENISVLSTKREGGRLVVEFGREYLELSPSRELLTRAALVKTLCQLSEVEYVEVIVGGASITNSEGEVIGAMTSGDFVDYFGREQDAIISENFTVYYVTEDGASLVKEIHRGYFESTMSMEQAVIKYMGEDPETVGAKSAISKNTNIINMTTTDGTCYLDMDMSFYDVESNVPYNISLTAIINSLCELNGIRNVRVNIIESETNVNKEIADTISGLYEKDMTYVIN